MTKKKGEVTVKEICAKKKYKFLVSIFIAVIGAFLFTILFQHSMMRKKRFLLMPLKIRFSKE